MIVAEAYLRIDSTVANDKRRALAVELLALADAASQEFFSKYETRRFGEVVIEDGSTKFWVRVRTSAAALAGFVIFYGDIRSGLAEMATDGKRAASWLVAQGQSVVPERPRFQRSRAPASTRLRRLFERVESGELSAEEATDSAEAILREYRESPDTIASVVALLRTEFATIRPLSPSGPPRRPRATPVRPPTPFVRGKRLSVFRDPTTGQLRFVEN